MITVENREVIRRTFFVEEKGSGGLHGNINALVQRCEKPAHPQNPRCIYELLADASDSLDGSLRIIVQQAESLL